LELEAFFPGKENAVFFSTVSQEKSDLLGTSSALEIDEEKVNVRSSNATLAFSFFVIPIPPSKDISILGAFSSLQ